MDLNEFLGSAARRVAGGFRFPVSSAFPERFLEWEDEDEATKTKRRIQLDIWTGCAVAVAGAEEQESSRRAGEQA